jgi:hypothetical protein
MKKGVGMAVVLQSELPISVPSLLGTSTCVTQSLHEPTNVALCATVFVVSSPSTIPKEKPHYWGSSFGAGCRIRTYEGECQLIYSQPCLTASLTLQVVRIIFYYRYAPLTPP